MGEENKEEKTEKKSASWKDTVIPVSLGSIGTLLGTVLAFGNADGKKEEAIKDHARRLGVLESYRESDRVFMHGVDRRLAVIGARLGAAGSMERISEEVQEKLKELEK